MSEFTDPKKLKSARSYMWIDQIIKNLDQIENDLFNKKYSNIHEALAEQYRLIQVLRNSKSGKTILQGWKTISS